MGEEIAHSIIILPGIIDILDVKPGCWRQGVGRRLVEYIFTDNGKTKLVPFSEDGKAKGFWDKMRSLGCCTECM